MGEEIRFTQEELNSIAALQRQYQEITFRFGQIVMEKSDIEARLTQNAVAFDNARKDLDNVRNQEKQLAATFQLKYGEGQLNFETGVFTPVQRPPTPAV